MTSVGGRGALHAIDGDYPSAALRGVKTQQENTSQGETLRLTILGKSVQSLQTDLREEELLAELRCIQWDVLLLSETWRERKQERWRTEDGHMFCGAGGKKGERGIGILLNRRWVKNFRAFHAVSERMCSLDVGIGGRKIRFVAVYMPHGGYDDADVEGTYVELDGLVSRAGDDSRKCILVGDWNAVVGPQQLGDDEGIVGLYGVGGRNARGEWLVQWASSHQLAIASTMIEKHFDEQWTYEKGGNQRQLDYCLMDVSLTSWLQDVLACNDIGVGSDHRTLKIGLAFNITKKCQGSKSWASNNGNMRGWKASNPEEYREEINAKLKALPNLVCGKGLVEKLGRRCKEIETILLDVADKCQEKTLEADDNLVESQKRLHELIGQRKSARTNGCRETVIQASKSIKKEIRAVVKARKSSRISKVLDEFKDLQRIASIRGSGKRHYMSSVMDSSGSEKTDKDDIAEVFAAFFESLYNGDAGEFMYDSLCNDVNAVTLAEIQFQLKRMKPRKAADDGGIVVELLSQGSDMLLQMVADIFTAVLNPQATIPEETSAYTKTIDRYALYLYCINYSAGFFAEGLKTD